MHGLLLYLGIMPSGVEEVRPEERAATSSTSKDLKAESAALAKAAADTPAEEKKLEQPEEEEGRDVSTSRKDSDGSTDASTEAAAGGGDSQRQQVQETASGDASGTGDQQEEQEGVEVVLEEKGTTKVVEKEKQQKKDGKNQEEKGENKDAAGRPTPDQNVFRHPEAARPPRATQQQQQQPGSYPPAPYGSSGSWGAPTGYGGGPPPPPYGPPLPPSPYRQSYNRDPYSAPYPVPPYGSSGSFDTADPGSSPFRPPPAAYSPHVQYPPPAGRGYPSEDINVISPSHKQGENPTPHRYHPHYRPDLTPRVRHMMASPHRSPHRPMQPSHYQFPPPSPVRLPGGSPSSGPPRVRDYAISRRAAATAAAGGAAESAGPYSKAQQRPGGSTEKHPDDGTWNSYGRSPSREMSTPIRKGGAKPQPPLIAESSFDSEALQSSAQRSLPSTPMRPPHPAISASASTGAGDPTVHSPFYGPPGSWGSFDSALPPPQSHYDGYYGQPPPESPYAPTSANPYMASPYSPVGSFYHAESFPPPPSYGPSGSFSYSYDEDERNALQSYNPDRDGQHLSSDAYHGKTVTPPTGHGKNRGRSKTDTPVASNTSRRSRAADDANSMLLPKAAEEVDFDVADPPSEPCAQPSDKPVCESLADVNTYDVLCGRGGGTNSQIGNRRFRKLVQDFQPTYLLARRKEKPLLARTIVLIIRKRGGRFLKKNEETGELYEVGDAKAEAKTSQALREGLDVRATKSAASSLLEKKKRNKEREKAAKDADLDDEDDDDVDSPSSNSKRNKAEATPHPGHFSGRPDSPPALPRLHGEEVKSALNTPSPDRKRRRMRKGGYQADRFFSDFCPPRADLARPASPGDHHHYFPASAYAGCPPPGYHGHQYPPHHAPPHYQHPALRRNPTDDLRLEDEAQPEASAAAAAARGCTGIALDVMSGAAATGSYCLGPGGWRR